jgi:hypothetical protein
MSDRTRTLLRWLAWAAGIGLVVFTVRRIGWRTVTDAVARVGPGILWLVAVYAVVTALMGLPWWLLLPRAHRPGPFAAVMSRFAATGLNSLLPLLAVGEVTRLLWVRRADRSDAIAAILVDRLLFVLASALSVVVGAAAVLFLPAAPRRLGLIAAAFALVLLAGAGIVGWIGAHTDPVAWLRRAIKSVRALTRLQDSGGVSDAAGAARTDEALHRILRGDRRTLLLGLGFHLLARVFVTLEIYLSCRLLDREIGLAGSLVLAAVPLALAVVGSFVPGQLGIQESAQGAIAAAIGLGGTVGVLVVLLQRVRQLLLLPITFLALATRSHPREDAELSASGGDPGSDRAARSAASAEEPPGPR